LQKKLPLLSASVSLDAPNFYQIRTKMKKLYLLAFSSFLSAALVFACQKNNQQNQESTAVATNETPQEAAAEAPTEEMSLTAPNEPSGYIYASGEGAEKQWIQIQYENNSDQAEALAIWYWSEKNKEKRAGKILSETEFRHEVLRGDVGKILVVELPFMANPIVLKHFMGSMSFEDAQGKKLDFEFEMMIE
jgi:hypothetical protein